MPSSVGFPPRGASSGARNSLRELRFLLLSTPPNPLKGGKQGSRPDLKQKKEENLSAFLLVVLPQGLEPWTPTLRVSCSTS